MKTLLSIICNCVNNSSGRDRAGVPLSKTTRFAAAANFVATSVTFALEFLSKCDSSCSARKFYFIFFLNHCGHTSINVFTYKNHKTVASFQDLVVHAFHQIVAANQNF